MVRFPPVHVLCALLQEGFEISRPRWLKAQRFIRGGVLITNFTSPEVFLRGCKIPVVLGWLQVGDESPEHELTNGTMIARCISELIIDAHRAENGVDTSSFQATFCWEAIEKRQSCSAQEPSETSQAQTLSTLLRTGYSRAHGNQDRPRFPGIHGIRVH